MLILDNFRGENRLKRGICNNSSKKSCNPCLYGISKELNNNEEMVLMNGDEEVEGMKDSTDFYEDEAQAPLALLGNRILIHQI